MALAIRRRRPRVHPQWVAVRTLHRRVQAAGETAGGQLVFEVNNLRLVLPDGFPHFCRLVTCRYCGLEFSDPRHAVQSAAELQATTTDTFFCSLCAERELEGLTPPE